MGEGNDWGPASVRVVVKKYGLDVGGGWVP